MPSGSELNIRAVQLTNKFFFGTKLLDRLYSDGQNCKLTFFDKTTIQAEMFIPNDNSFHIYWIPRSICIVEVM